MERFGRRVAHGPARGSRATGQQRACIVALRRRAGRAGEPLPSGLSRAEASRIIDTLRSEMP